MRIALAAATLIACGGTPSDGADAGWPMTGRWSPLAGEAGWSCTQPAGSSLPCTAPAPFDVRPESVAVSDDGVLAWPGVEHRGAIDGLCVHVPAATDGAHERAAYSFCGDETGIAAGRALVVLSVRWDIATPGACACQAMLSGPHR